MFKEIINIKNLTIQLSTLVLSGLIAFLINVIVFRYTDVNFYSDFSYALSLGSILAILFDAGCKNILLIEGSNQNSEYNKNILYYTIFFSTIVFLLITIVEIFFFNIKIILISINFFLIVLCQQIAFQLKGRGFYQQEFFWQLYFRSINFIFIIFALMLYEKNLSFLLIFWSISSLISIIFFSKIKIQYFNFILKGFKKYFKIFFSNSLIPLLLIEISIVINLKLNILLMKHLSISDQHISHFAAALRLFEIIIVLVHPLAVLSLRYFVKKNIIDTLEFQIFIFKMIIIGSFVFLIYYIFADQISYFIFTDKKGEISEILKILSIGYVLMIPNTICFQYLLSRGKQKILSILLSTVTIICVLINIEFIKTYGAIGSAYALIIFEGIIFLLIFSLARNIQIKSMN